MTRRDNALIVLQARMGSSRLPGKVLMPIAGRSILAHCIARLQSSGLPVVVATTVRRNDDAVAEEARAAGAEVVRGSEWDVLDRVVMAVERFQPEYVIRATADNPAVDPEGPRRLLRIVRAERADHAVESGLPCGAAVEVVSADALRIAGAFAFEAYDREHVTPFIRQRARRFTVISPPAPAPVYAPDLRFTVDTASDYRYLREVFEGAANDALPTLIAAARSLGVTTGAA